MKIPGFFLFTIQSVSGYNYFITIYRGKKMAFATITFKSKSGIVKEAPVGFSWTTLFFGFFPAMIRGDWLWAIIIFGAAMITLGLSTIIFAFIYNRIYIQGMMKQGFKVKSYSGGNKALIERKAQIKLRK